MYQLKVLWKIPKISAPTEVKHQSGVEITKDRIACQQYRTKRCAVLDGLPACLHDQKSHKSIVSAPMKLGQVVSWGAFYEDVALL